MLECCSASPGYDPGKINGLQSEGAVRRSGVCRMSSDAGRDVRHEAAALEWRAIHARKTVFSGVSMDDETWKVLLEVYVAQTGDRQYALAEEHLDDGLETGSDAIAARLVRAGLLRVVSAGNTGRRIAILTADGLRCMGTYLEVFSIDSYIRHREALWQHGRQAMEQTSR